ncbi:MAG TPA: hypothetical protein VHP11_14885 [Tepidisphaeraceae bacterium]|nr:hypothetical protein [Tepidisphaeraceae bacterium]
MGLKLSWQGVFIVVLTGICGCTYPPKRGAWSGTVLPVVVHGEENAEYRLAGLKVESGTALPDPYAGFVLVESPVLVWKGKTIYFSSFEPADQVTVKGKMKFGDLISPDGKRPIGEHREINGERAYLGGWIIDLSQYPKVTKTAAGGLPQSQARDSEG